MRLAEAAAVLESEPLDLYSAFANRTDGASTMEVQTIGYLAHAGTIVACDPLLGDGEPFARQVPPGVHPVEALIVRERNDERVALARVVFSTAVPVTFELATRGDEDVRALAPGQQFGYGVDTGTGCFAVPGAVEACDADALIAHFDDHRRITWSWGVALPAQGGHGLVAFSSGGGDGSYASYFGLAADRTPVCLITDFGCLALSLPALPDDPAFRKQHASTMYERMMASVPQLGGPEHGSAYIAASELTSSPADAAHLVEQLVQHLRATRDELERDLYRYVLKSLVRSTEIQRALAAHLGTFDDTTRLRLAGVHGESIDPSWLAALRSLWAEAAPELRANILEHELAAARHGPDPRAQIPTAHAIESLTCDDERLVEGALRVLELELRRTNGGGLPDTVVQRVRAVAARPPGPRVKFKAMHLMSRLGIGLDRELASPDPRTRLAAASALGRDRAHAARADEVLIALAHDRGLEVELRWEASGRIHDRAANIAAKIVLGLAGHVAAPIQLRYLGGPDAIAGLERLIVEATSPAVRAEAEKHVVTARAIESNRQPRG
jgi:hypothetical protein